MSSIDYPAARGLRRCEFRANYNNKLFGRALSTIRPAVVRPFEVGELVGLYLLQAGDEDFVGAARIVAKEALLLSEITDAMAYLDIGYPAAELVRLMTGAYGSRVIHPDAKVFRYVIVKLDGCELDDEKVIDFKGGAR